MNGFNRDNVRAFRKEIADALAHLEHKYGVTFELGNISFSFSEWHGKLSCKVGTVEELQEKKSLEPKENLDRYGQVYGISPEVYDKVFEINGKRFKVTGLKLHARKAPSVMIDSLANGKPFIIPVDAFKRYAKPLEDTGAFLARRMVITHKERI
jgi:hypothetical protein